jgi:hypothetical protein
MGVWEMILSLQEKEVECGGDDTILSPTYINMVIIFVYCHIYINSVYQRMHIIYKTPINTNSNSIIR